MFLGEELQQDNVATHNSDRAKIAFRKWGGSSRKLANNLVFIEERCFSATFFKLFVEKSFWLFPWITCKNYNLDPDRLNAIIRLGGKYTTFHKFFFDIKLLTKRYLRLVIVRKQILFVRIIFTKRNSYL